MFSKETAKKISYVLNAEVEREFKLMLDDLIQQELSKMAAHTPDSELRTIAVKKETYEKLKNYRQFLEDARDR